MMTLFPRMLSASILLLLAFFFSMCSLVRPNSIPSTSIPCWKSESGARFKFIPEKKPENTSHGKIVFACSTGSYYDIIVMNSDGSGMRDLTPGRLNEYAPTWSWDEKYIFFSRADENQFDIYRMDGDGSHLLQITDDAAFEMDPTPSPDGKQVAFYSDAGKSGPGEKRYIYVVNIDGSGLTRLVEGFYPAWSPDGQWIAYTDFDGTGFVIRPDGSDTKILARLEEKKLSQPAWSWDGKRIAYATRYDQTTQEQRDKHFGEGEWITILDMNGSVVLDLNDVPLHLVHEPSWSPDGNWVSVMTQTDDGGFVISIIKTDGSGDVIHLTEGLEDSESASWGN